MEYVEAFYYKSSLSLKQWPFLLSGLVGDTRALISLDEFNGYSGGERSRGLQPMAVAHALVFAFGRKISTVSASVFSPTLHLTSAQTDLIWHA